MHEDTLARVELFSGLDKRELRTLGESCQERKYGAGKPIMAQGDTGVGLYVITSGKVRITHSSGAGQPEDELGTAGAGDVLGEMALLDDLPRSATITAVEDVTALVLPIWEFRTVLRNHPEIALKLLTVLSRRLRRAEQRPMNKD